METTHKAALTSPLFRSVVSAPTFSVEILNNSSEILRITYAERAPEMTAENALAKSAVEQIQAYFADPEFVFSLPLRLAGTPFQQRVWQAISAICNGKTQTYGDIASALKNNPRAVGQACGANPYPLVVPCHRVVAANGGLGGFARHRGGFLLDIKRTLLQHEGALNRAD